MFVKAHLVIVQGHSTYSFRLYLTTKSPVQIENYHSLSFKETDQAHGSSPFWKWTSVLSFKKKTRMKKHRLPNRLGLTVCPTCTTVWDSWSLCHLRAAQCCSSVRSTELFQSVHMYGSHIEYCSANHSHHHQQNSGVPSMATNIQFIHPYLINTGLESEESKTRHSAK